MYRLLPGRNEVLRDVVFFNPLGRLRSVAACPEIEVWDIILDPERERAHSCLSVSVTRDKFTSAMLHSLLLYVGLLEGAILRLNIRFLRGLGLTVPSSFWTACAFHEHTSLSVAGKWS